VLRNPLDRQFTKPPGTGMATLFGGSAPKPRPAVLHPAAARVEKPAVIVVQVINGSRQVQQTFPSQGAVR
jgi:hypothetical protein